MENKTKNNFPLTNTNLKLLAVGFIIIIIGFILMSGGKSDNPNVFNPDIFSFRRIILAPIIVVTGFMFEIYAIMHKTKEDNEQKTK